MLTSLKGLGLPSIFEKYKGLKDGDSIEEVIEDSEELI